MAFAERLGNFIWNPWLLGLFLLSGLYFSVRTGFFQLFHVRLWLKTTLGSLLRPKRRREGGGLTQLQALSTALASTIGTGSIAGVATAIFYGGPGAVFWMWVSAFLGMMTKYAEVLLAVAVIMGIWVRMSALILSLGILLMFAWGGFGAGELEFVWLGVYVFLIISGGGLYAFDTALTPAKPKK